MPRCCVRPSLLGSLEEMLGPLTGDGVLAPANARCLLLGVGEFLGKRVETALRKHAFSSLGALQLDKDVRSIVNWFAVRRGGLVRGKERRMNF